MFYVTIPRILILHVLRILGGVKKNSPGRKRSIKTIETLGEMRLIFNKKALKFIK